MENILELKDALNRKFGRWDGSEESRPARRAIIISVHTIKSSDVEEILQAIERIRLPSDAVLEARESEEILPPSGVAAVSVALRAFDFSSIETKDDSPSVRLSDFIPSIAKS